MDVPRQGVARKKRIRRVLYGVLTVAAIAVITFGLSRLERAAPSVERATVVIDAVKRGSMVRQVRGLGTLVPLEIRWIPAFTSGRVEKRMVLPGTEVRPETIIFELSNPELEQALLEAQSQLRSAEAEYDNRKVELETQLLNQRAQAATVQADFSQAKLQAEANETLAKEGLVSDLVLKQSRARAQELATRFELEQQRLKMNQEAVKTQLAVQEAQLEQRRTQAALRRQQVDQLRVRAGMHGVLQQLAVEVGQQVTPGTNLARVADLTRLKAEVRIAETQAKDIQIGLIASIDTRNGVIPGRVIRIDPAAQNGTVTVDVALEGELPKGARPDMSVDGTVELERLEDVLYVQRPAFGQERSTITLFRLEPDGQHAVRTQVTLGRSSVTTIELISGLQVGDRVILSDTSQFDTADRIRLN
ncbi:MAG: efflux RND transporter periplasmic adaptor subunit [Acidobacteria bacterium]|nr:efflux RND transporter periplasmic adaptor subunit [Acidobacteriota bacterium]MCW5971025.1 efflux RND transporter periplasmic adaptor subunit [Blastocatellales bacterium]